MLFPEYDISNAFEYLQMLCSPKTWRDTDSSSGSAEYKTMLIANIKTVPIWNFKSENAELFARKDG